MNKKSFLFFIFKSFVFLMEFSNNSKSTGFVAFLNWNALIFCELTFQRGFQLPRTSGRQTQRLVSRDQALRLRSKLWIMLQVCLQLLGHQQRQSLVSQGQALRLRSKLWIMAEATAGVTKPGIAPAQHSVDYVAGMFTAARTSGGRIISNKLKDNEQIL
jgi:hypothetical protein